MTKGLGRRGRPVTAVCAVALLLAGGAWWWANRVPMVRVPNRACGGALSGNAVAAIFPDKGGEYQERLWSTFDPGGNDSLNIWCSMRAADKSALASYTWISPGVADGFENGTPSKLGQTKGYTRPFIAKLFVPCLSSGRERYSWLMVTIERFAKNPKDPVEVDDQRDPALMAELVADAARHVTRQLKCETASGFPAGPPVMGAGASD